MKAHEAAVELFAREGVDTAFTLLSEEIIDIVSEMEDNWGDTFEVIDCRHEQGAALMADGFSRIDGGIGLCIVGRGPAIAQTGTALVAAQNNASRVLYLVPETRLGSTHDGKGFQQETYLRAMAGEVVSVRSPGNLVPELTQVIHRLRAGEGPIAVQVPTDVLGAEVPDDTVESLPDRDRPTARGPVEPDPDRIEAAVDAYLDSDATKAPIILAGRGAQAAGAKAAIEDLAERMGAYLVTSLRAIGYFGDHPYGLGPAGDLGSTLANELVLESDFVLAVGASLNKHTVDAGELLAEGVKIVHVDTGPTHIGRFTDVDVGVVGDARLAAEALHDELEALGIDRAGEFWTDRIADRVAEHSSASDRAFEAVPGTVDPRELVVALDDVLPAARRMVSDVGHFTAWIFDGLSFTPEDRHLWTVDFLALGQALPLCVGQALAAADGRTPITFVGDGGLMMIVQELETAARHGVPMIVVVFNDDALGAEYHMAQLRGFSGESGRSGDVDFAAIAEDVGASGHTIRSVEDLEALAPALSGELDGPVVLDCKVNPEAVHRSMGSLDIE